MLEGDGYSMVEAFGVISENVGGFYLPTTVTYLVKGRVEKWC